MVDRLSSHHGVFSLQSMGPRKIDSSDEALKVSFTIVPHDGHADYLVLGQISHCSIIIKTCESHHRLLMQIHWDGGAWR